MKKDIDLQILEFYWNRLSYWQKKWMRVDAAIHTANENILHWLLVLLLMIGFTVTRGLPRSERRIVKTSHYVNDRRRQRVGGAVQFTFLFILATITAAAWSIATQSPAHIAAPIIFAAIAFLNILIFVRPKTRMTAHSRPRKGTTQWTTS